MDLQALETGGMVVIGLGLIEIIKLLIAKRQNGKKENTMELPEEQKNQLRSLHNMHHQFDESGAPKWFFPPVVITNQVKTIDCLNILVNNVENLTRAVDNLTDKVN